MKTILLTLNEFSKELTAIALKWWVYLFWITLAVVAKISYDGSMGKKITIWQILLSSGLAFPFGLFAANICIGLGTKTYIGTSIAIFVTLVCDKVFTWIIANYKGILRHLLNYRPDEEDKP